MRSSCKCGLIICVVIVGAVLTASTMWVVLSGSPGIGCLLAIFTQVSESQRARERVLCGIDHQTLRQAGRELLKRAAEGNLREHMYYRVKDRRPGPEVSQFPQAILDLAPEYVIVEDGRLDIGMYAGGFDHCGVLVYPEGFVEPYPGFKCGHRKLIDGLWYYDDEYNNDPEYGKVIDTWISKGRNKAMAEAAAE